MTDLLEALFTYANTHQAKYPQEEPLQHTLLCRDLERTENTIKNLLPPEASQQFEDYISKNLQVQLLDLKSTFRAGLSIGLELSRL